MKHYEFIRNPVHKDARYNFLSGSVRSGKTWAMIPKLLQLCQEDTWGVPKGLGLIIGASKDAVKDNVLNDLFDVIGPAAYSFNKQTGDLRLFNSKWKVIGANDERSERYVRGKTVAKAYVDEGTTLPESFFRQLDFRLSPPGAKMYITTNPDSPMHYMYKDFIANKKINEEGSGRCRTINFYLDDNPHLSEEYKASIREAHSGVYYQRFVLGQWVMAEGLIYRDCWDDQGNTFDDGEPGVPPDLYVNYMARYIGVDYGTVNPMCFLDVIDDGTTLWVVNEYWFDSAAEQRQRTDSEYAEAFAEFAQGRQDARVLIDPSAASFQLEVRQRGFLVQDADNDVANGIKWVSSMLTRRLIRIHRRRCPNLLRERGLYCWDKKASLLGKEQPIKQNDHGMDCLRYIIKTMIQPYRLCLT